MPIALSRLLWSGSSGLRVNSAADDAAGLTVAGKMESQLRGIHIAIRNNQDGVGLIQTAESGLNEVRNMVLRIRELAVQMANGIYENTPDRANAQLEVTALLNQVDLIAENTKFNDAFLDGTFSAVAIQAGNTTAETISLSFADLGQTGLSINGASIATQASATTVIGQWTQRCSQSLKNKQTSVRTKPLKLLHLKPRPRKCYD